MSTIIQFLAERSKAIRGALTTLVGALTLVIVGNESFADVTTAEWLIVVGAVLGTGAVVERSTNRTAPSTGKHSVDG